MKFRTRVRLSADPPIDITSELAHFEISDGWLALVINLKKYEEGR
jgi:hypothetical protein